MAATSPARDSSRTPAREMTRADICNVEPLTPDDVDALGIPTAMAGLDVETLDALGWGDRWTLTEGGEQ